MDPAIVALLFFVAAVSAAAYWTGFMAPGVRWRWLAQGGFATGAFVLTPALLITLYGQHRAWPAVRSLGLAAHPRLRHAVGLALPGAPGERTWVFAVSAPPESVTAFYRRESTHEGWGMVEENGNLLILERGADRLTVGAAAGWRDAHLIVMLRRR